MPAGQLKPNVKREHSSSASQFDQLLEAIESSKSERLEEELAGQTEEGIIGLIKNSLREHFESLGYIMNNDGNLELGKRTKNELRVLQRAKKQEQIVRNFEFVAQRGYQLLDHIANGEDVNPADVRPKLVEVKAGTMESNLFRFLTLYWSVPVSQGYGRRMRFLIIDEQNGKVIGLFGLTDPVFNLRVRDNWIDWDLESKRRNLRSVMDAFVLGAVPPYSLMLGGKLVCTLLAAEEVRQAYAKKYAGMKAVISGREHSENLLLITTTSALGKSSLYDRVKLGKRRFFTSVGVTEGYGHFHIPADTFRLMRELLVMKEHPYAKKNRFGHGPNWRMRVIRVALTECGMSADILRHQIRRESFMIPLARNTRECLRGDQNEPNFHDGDISSITELALNRWVLPRAERRPEYKTWKKESIVRYILEMMREGQTDDTD